ncbi:ABC transporter substrate-binding protein [Nocardioides sp.]|uniref:ABC transporter substrate-binding protein n=1 Tax=Nocardioides sp. TaxID=35761 RepID=UPI003D09F6AC
MDQLDRLGEGTAMQRSLRLRSALLLSGVLVGLAACSSAGKTDDGGSKQATDATIPTLTYGLEAIPPTLDVANNYSSADMAVMGLVTQPLEIANLDGTFTPVLAEKVSEPDRTTLVYDLRKDATFSDGSPLTADDVVWTVEHLRGATTQTVSELTNFDTVRATGEHQVTITLKRPNNAMRGSFAIISFVQEATSAEAAGDDLGTPQAPPIGTGPYVVDSFDASGVTLKRNDEYVGEKPAPDEVRFTAITDDTAAQLAMRSGELDLYPLIDVKTTKTWGSVPGAETYSTQTLYVDYVTMNMSVKPFDDIHVRRAVAYATDVTGLIQANYGGEADEPVAITPVQIIDRLAPDAAAVSDLTAPFDQVAYDMDKAEAELAQSAYPDGFTAEYEYYSPQGKIVGLSLAENLKQIGITLELKSRRINDFIGDLFVNKVPDIGFFSIAAVVPDPASWYVYLVGKDNPYNAARYSTAQTEAALAVINESDDDAARWEAMKTITTAFADDIPYVGLAQSNFVVAAADGVTFTEDPDFMEMSTGDWVNNIKSTK